jgi:hypothetical protein
MHAQGSMCAARAGGIRAGPGGGHRAPHCASAPGGQCAACVRARARWRRRGAVLHAPSFPSTRPWPWASCRALLSVAPGPRSVLPWAQWIGRRGVWAQCSAPTEDVRAHTATATLAAERRAGCCSGAAYQTTKKAILSYQAAATVQSKRDGVSPGSIEIPFARQIPTHLLFLRRVWCLKAIKLASRHGGAHCVTPTQAAAFPLSAWRRRHARGRAAGPDRPAIAQAGCFLRWFH